MALQRIVAKGMRGAMVYLIQRMDASAFEPADGIDPHYGEVLRQTVDRGVEVFADDVCLDLEKIALGRPLPIRL
jgi:sugar fermentation stimulation protein A